MASESSPFCYFAYVIARVFLPRPVSEGQKFKCVQGQPGQLRETLSQNIRQKEGWGWRSVLELLPSTCEALGSSPTHTQFSPKLRILIFCFVLFFPNQRSLIRKVS